MKVIMTGGGTGGHIYPAIAIADKIKSKNPDAEILFVGTRRGLERDLVPKILSRMLKRCVIWQRAAVNQNAYLRNLRLML